jgi:hypothetical protein
MPRGGKQYVTGLTVFDSIRPRITKKIKRNLRLELYYLTLYGLKGHTLKKMNYSISEYEADINIKIRVDEEINSINNRITGWLRFMYSVEKPIAKKLIDQYKLINR